MKPVFETVELAEDSSIRVLSYQCNAFQDDHSWHYHPEYELSYIVRGDGTRFVGDNVEHYGSGDLVLLGPNIPHCWISNSPDSKNPQSCEMVVIQFPESFLGDNFIHIPEAKKLKRLLMHSGRGLHFNKKTSSMACVLMRELNETSGLIRVSLFLKLLDILCDAEGRALASESYSIGSSDFKDDRMKDILKYIQQNISSQIKQTDAARIVGMTPQSFSRFFKSTTGRTFVSFVNVMRIAKACHLLINTRKDILEISLECGYSNLSNFNRQFSERKGITPRTYRSEQQQLQK